MNKLNYTLELPPWSFQVTESIKEKQVYLPKHRLGETAGFQFSTFTVVSLYWSSIFIVFSFSMAYLVIYFKGLVIIGFH